MGMAGEHEEAGLRARLALYWTRLGMYWIRLASYLGSGWLRIRPPGRFFHAASRIEGLCSYAHIRI